MTVIDSASEHYCQPPWPLGGGGPVAAPYGIEVHLENESVEVDAGRREALVRNSKSDTRDPISTGAGICKPTRVVVENLSAVPAGPGAHGLVQRVRVVSVDVIDTTKERKDMCLLENYVSPALYRNLMLMDLA